MSSGQSQGVVMGEVAHAKARRGESRERAQRAPDPCWPLLCYGKEAARAPRGFPGVPRYYFFGRFTLVTAASF
jgi:hypothetical protein